MTSLPNTETTTGELPGLNCGAAQVDFRPPIPDVDGLSEEVKEVLAQLLDSPGTESSSSISSASSLPVLRNDNGEAVWRLTEKAMAYLRGLQGLPFRTVDEVLPVRARDSERCASVETSGASCE